jgi:hypothetical protein
MIIDQGMHVQVQQAVSNASQLAKGSRHSSMRIAKQQVV